MPKIHSKKRKRSTGSITPQTEFSASLATARNLVASGKQPEGLAALNQLAAATQNPARRGKILLLVGESQASFSRHTEAVAAFGKASQLANQAVDYELLLRAGFGQVRSLLRSLHAAQAKVAAQQLISNSSAT